MIIGDELWLSSRLPPGRVSADASISTYPFQHGKLTMYQHLQARHFGWEGRVSQGQELEEFRKQITITYEEEARLQRSQRVVAVCTLSALTCAMPTHCTFRLFAMNAAILQEGQDALHCPIHFPFNLFNYQQPLINVCYLICTIQMSLRTV